MTKSRRRSSRKWARARRIRGFNMTGRLWGGALSERPSASKGQSILSAIASMVSRGGARGG